MVRPSDDMEQLLQLYESALLDDVIPWWMEHGIDWEQGGVTETIAEDGTIASYDKSIWSLGRALFVWSRLYNLIGRRWEWLDVANRICEFMLPIGLENGWVWPGSVHRDGTLKNPSNAVYADGFAIMGLTEYAQATGDKRATEAARATYETLPKRMEALGTHLATPESIAQIGKCHGISMIFSTVFHELGKLLDDAEILQAGHDHAVLIQDQFLKPERKLVLEYTALDGSELDPPEGRFAIPGHAIESMWFGIHIFRDRYEKNRIATAAEAIKWHVEAAWDPEYGGLFHAIDADGDTDRVSPDGLKIMWPHTEALYALLLAYEASGEQWCLDWYDRVHEWSWQHFPVSEHGEWHRQVARDGSHPWGVDGPYEKPRKEPFHLPRALIMCVDVLRRLAGN